MGQSPGDTVGLSHEVDLDLDLDSKEPHRGTKNALRKNRPFRWKYRNRRRKRKRARNRRKGGLVTVLFASSDTDSFNRPPLCITLQSPVSRIRQARHEVNCYYEECLHWDERPSYEKNSLDATVHYVEDDEVRQTQLVTLIGQATINDKDIVQVTNDPEIVQGKHSPEIDRSTNCCELEVTNFQNNVTSQLQNAQVSCVNDIDQVTFCPQLDLMIYSPEIQKETSYPELDEANNRPETRQLTNFTKRDHVTNCLEFNQLTYIIVINQVINCLEIGQWSKYGETNQVIKCIENAQVTDNPECDQVTNCPEFAHERNTPKIIQVDNCPEINLVVSCPEIEREKSHLEILVIDSPDIEQLAKGFEIEQVTKFPEIVLVTNSSKINKEINNPAIDQVNFCSQIDQVTNYHEIDQVTICPDVRQVTNFSEVDQDIKTFDIAQVPDYSKIAKDSNTILCPSLSFSDHSAGEPTFSELVVSFDNRIVPDDNHDCGFAVIYPDSSMEGETGNDELPTASRASVGTQLGEGILSDSVMAVAVEFAEQHNYGFVQFVDDTPVKKGMSKLKRQNKRKAFAKVSSRPFLTRSVVRKDFQTTNRWSRSARCSAGGNQESMSYLEQVGKNLSSVEDIADQISDIQIPDYRNFLPRSKKSPMKKRKNSQKANEHATTIDAEVKSKDENEDEIIRSAPLDKYMEYLSKVCENIYQSKGGIDDMKTSQIPSGAVGPIQVEAGRGDTLSEGPALNARDVDVGPPPSSEKQGAGIPISPSAEIGQNERKKSMERTGNNINVSNKTHRCEKLQGSKEERSTDASPSRGPPSLYSHSKCSKQYRFYNSLTSCILRELKCVGTEEGSGLGVKSDLLKSRMEIVRHSEFPSDTADDCADSDNVAQSDVGDPFHRETAKVSSRQGGRKASSSPSRPTMSSRAVRQQSPICDDSSSRPHLHTGSKPHHKSDYAVSSCPDLSNSETRDPGRKKENSPIKTRSPSRDIAAVVVVKKQQANDSIAESDKVPAPGNTSLTSCAQGDVKSPPSLFADDVRRQEQGDVEATPK